MMKSFKSIPAYFIVIFLFGIYLILSYISNCHHNKHETYQDYYAQLQEISAIFTEELDYLNATSLNPKLLHTKDYRANSNSYSVSDHSSLNDYNGIEENNYILHGVSISKINPLNTKSSFYRGNGIEFSLSEMMDYLLTKISLDEKYLILSEGHDIIWSSSLLEKNAFDYLKMEANIIDPRGGSNRVHFYGESYTIFSIINLYPSGQQFQLTLLVDDIALEKSVDRKKVLTICSLIIVLVILICFYPTIKFKLMGPYESISINDYKFSKFSILLLSCIFGILLAELIWVQRKQQVDHQLQSHLANNVSQYFDEMLITVAEALLKFDVISTSNEQVVFETMAGRESTVTSFNRMNSRGDEILLASSKDNVDFRNYSNQSYFKHALGGKDLFTYIPLVDSSYHCSVTFEHENNISDTSIKLVSESTNIIAAKVKYALSVADKVEPDNNHINNEIPSFLNLLQKDASVIYSKELNMSGSYANINSCLYLPSASRQLWFSIIDSKLEIASQLNANQTLPDECRMLNTMLDEWLTSACNLEKLMPSDTLLFFLTTYYIPDSLSIVNHTQNIPYYNSLFQQRMSLFGDYSERIIFEDSYRLNLNIVNRPRDKSKYIVNGPYSFYLEPIVSITDGKSKYVVSMPSRSGYSLKLEDREVVSSTFLMDDLNSIDLPLNTKLIIFEQSGKIIYDSNSHRSKTQSIYDRVKESSLLKELVSDETQFTHEKSCQFTIDREKTDCILVRSGRFSNNFTTIIYTENAEGMGVFKRVVEFNLYLFILIGLFFAIFIWKKAISICPLILQRNRNGKIRLLFRVRQYGIPCYQLLYWKKKKSHYGLSMRGFMTVYRTTNITWHKLQNVSIVSALLLFMSVSLSLSFRDEARAYNELESRMSKPKSTLSYFSKPEGDQFKELYRGTSASAFISNFLFSDMGRKTAVYVADHSKSSYSVYLTAFNNSSLFCLILVVFFFLYISWIKHFFSIRYIVKRLPESKKRSELEMKKALKQLTGHERIILQNLRCGPIVCKDKISILSLYKKGFITKQNHYGVPKIHRNMTTEVWQVFDGLPHVEAPQTYGLDLQKSKPILIVIGLVFVTLILKNFVSSMSLASLGVFITTIAGVVQALKHLGFVSSKSNETKNATNEPSNGKTIGKSRWRVRGR